MKCFIVTHVLIFLLSPDKLFFRTIVKVLEPISIVSAKLF